MFQVTGKRKQCAVPVTPDEMRNEKGYIEFAKQMSGVGEKLAAEGIVLSYHNHSFEFQKYNGKTGLELIYANSDPKFFQGEIDTSWIQHGGGDVVMWCRKLKGRLPVVHLKDYVVTADGPDFCEILEGNLNWPAIFKACQDAGTEWYPIEQDTCPGEPIESLRLSFNNLKGFFSEN